ncbi:MAG TPA: hypothetical protein VGH28_25695 [Polyangiaceae bacterium]
MIFLFILSGCAAGPRDTLGGGGPVVHAEAGAPQEYSYVARRPLVAVGLAKVDGLSEEDAHAIVDHLADSATACLRERKALSAGAARITLPIDAGGIAGAPDVVFAPQEASAVGLVCILAPLRMSAFSPSDAGVRSITIESAWGTQ